jgi:hypothetical protein
MNAKYLFRITLTASYLPRAMGHPSFFLIANQYDFNQVSSMKSLHIRSASGQLAEYIKKEIWAGLSKDYMPGEIDLSPTCR